MAVHIVRVGAVIAGELEIMGPLFLVLDLAMYRIYVAEDKQSRQVPGRSWLEERSWSCRC